MSTTNNASSFERFMASGYGRLIRGALGLSIITVAILWLDGAIAVAVAGLGLIPVLAGIFGLCPVAPLWGGHFVGAKYCGSERRIRD